MANLLSAAVGAPFRPVGYENRDQVWWFLRKGGLIPSKHVDIRSVIVSGPSTVQSITDPGISWVWAAASRLGMPLSVAGLARLQVAVDFLALLLTIGLAWRMAGPVAGGLAGVLFGRNAIAAGATLQMAYYYWGIPASLVAAHLILLAVRRETRWMPWLAFCAWCGLLVWIRAIWLPVVLACQVIPVLHWRRRGIPLAAVGLGIVLASYGLLLARASSTGLQGIEHPRQQVWASIYEGLGWYSNYPSIQFNDASALRLADRAGIDGDDPKAYDQFFRELFLSELAHAPRRYLATVIRRFGDFADRLRQGYQLRKPSPDSVLGGLVVGGMFVGAWLLRRRDALVIFSLYAAILSTWSLLTPPQLNYSVETLGLACPLAAILLAGLFALAARALHRIVKDSNSLKGLGAAWKVGG